ncbi:hydrophobin-251, variant 2 [Coprinopsis cinerea AmutBmut pab1-1]|nr:hydrophobin-251, variant 2 [Coprinopsis cinerea AmutBmut pab1-1]
MFARLSSALVAFTLAASAMAAPTSGVVAQCNGGVVQCCNEMQSSTSLEAPIAGLLSLLGIDLSGLTGQVGLTCTDVTVIGVGGGSSCNNQQVCCNNNNFSKLSQFVYLSTGLRAGY